MDDVNRVRVLVVDDDPLVRASLNMIFAGAPGISVVGEAADGRDALAAVRQHRPDVVLIDIRMPLMNGLEATEHLRSWSDPPKVIVLTTFHVDDYVVRALRAGASGFLLKDTAPAAIVEAVHRVAEGEPMLSPSVLAQVIAQVTAAPAGDRSGLARQQLARLTDRERTVALEVARGRTNAEIASSLHLSVPTVKAHIGRIFTKLDVDNRVQVAICVHDAQQG
jgi:DNA-binding NarL/FixJ family response regulator